VVDQDNADLTAVVSIDRAGGVDHGHTELRRQAAARPDLALVAWRERDLDPGRNGVELPRREFDRLWEWCSTVRRCP
jgi:hypothetical protein